MVTAKSQERMGQRTGAGDLEFYCHQRMAGRANSATFPGNIQFDAKGKKENRSIIEGA